MEIRVIMGDRQVQASVGWFAMVNQEDRKLFHPESLLQWREWLLAHHQDGDGVWMVSWKAATGRPRISYEEAVVEALAFGWVDSRSASLDDERSILFFTRRKAASPWSLTNKARVAQLEAEGRMQEAGRAAIVAAKANGMWTLLDDAQNLVVPDDLAQALEALPGARQNWDGFPGSARRIILEWIVLAKRPDTRASRIEETARKAALGERANQRD